MRGNLTILNAPLNPSCLVIREIQQKMDSLLKQEVPSSYSASTINPENGIKQVNNFFTHV